jgi:hypothetical protein
MRLAYYSCSGLHHGGPAYLELGSCLTELLELIYGAVLAYDNYFGNLAEFSSKSVMASLC